MYFLSSYMQIQDKTKNSAKVRNNILGVRISARRRILWSTRASGLDENIVLSSKGHRAKRDDKEEIGNIGLDALPVQDLTFTRVAGLVDDLLEQVGELLDDGHRLSRGETHAVHRGCCVVR